MITAVVQFQMSRPLSLSDATEKFKSSAPIYKNMAGLIRKYYICSEDGKIAGGVYLWESREAAENVYKGQWRERVEKAFGGKPSIMWFDSPVIVENLAGGKITFD